ncbi:hypothetical protein [Massilia cavernae]|uniref:Uncharacterized protein n=1 Tax=Massilia cavernae TaxID=2320864 RepID=A0A418X7L9_9BURK|nr:hypothetical protein [Massilia cavernae]RJG08398.1 hypothetical protein D3872_24150 [Massilia cavernae]
MKLGCSHYRLIAAIVMFFMMGLQFANGHSTSHLQLEHRHPGVAAYESAADGGHHHDHDDVPTLDEESEKHTHKHDPGDHTHDLPLRLVRATIEFAFLPDWHPATPVSVHSNTLYPLERPPKRVSAA